MRVVVFDMETEAIPPTGVGGVDTIWCIVCKEIGVDGHVVFTRNGEFGYRSLTEFKSYASGVDKWVAHNGLGFDVPVVNRVLGANIDPQDVVDTFVVSRLVNYSRYATHSLDELGQRLGVLKGKFNDWSQLTQEMIDYCIQDVVVTEKVYDMYKKYINDPEWQQSMRLEHDLVLVNNDMTENGFMFDKAKAMVLLEYIKMEMSVLEDRFQEQWPPSIQEVNRLQYRSKADGTLYATTQSAIDRYPKTWVDNGDLVCGDYVSFNPGSTKDRIEKLWDAGWKPIEKTKGHNKFLREAEVGKPYGKTKMTSALYNEKKEHFDYYGWTVSETNLMTLPESAPEGAKQLAEWLCLEGRRSSLTEWINCVCDDGRIRGKFWGIGAWTHRMSHSSPNMANIFSPFHGTPRNAVERVKEKYDRDLRALWTTDKVLVGTDADGIQLRILCHYMKSEEYRDAILEGSKEDETDIHNVNKRALGLNHINRDDAKTFIYAWVLGAGGAKVASILRTGTRQVKAAVDSFLASLPGLKKLKQGQIKRDAMRGFFTGLDGRKVLCNSDHLMLAGYLQNAEKVCTAMWILEWRKLANEAGLWYRHVDYVHDEVQVEVLTEEDGARLIEIQQKAIRNVSDRLDLFCPLDVSGTVGYSWAETH